MNIYDLFRACINSAALPQAEVEDSLNLIEKLQNANAFGTVAAITTGYHDYRDTVNHGRHICGTCGKGPEAH